MGFRLTELADILRISRPTLYRYIELYESGDYDGIRGDILMLFGFISSNPSASKRDVMQYMVSNIGFLDEGKPDGRIDTIAEVIGRTGCSRQKLDLILAIVNGDVLDPVVPYLLECVRVLNKGTFSEEDMALVGKFVLFRQSVLSNRPLTDDEIETVRRIIE